MSGLRFFSRASDGSLVLATYTPSNSYCWAWSVSLTKRGPEHGLMHFDRRRFGQWHDYIRLPFRWLIISRQDYHKDPRHQRGAA